MTGLVPVLVPATLPTPAWGRTTVAYPSRRSLPLPPLLGRRVRTTVYGLAVVDDRGRISDRTVIGSLGWTASTRLDLREQAGRVVVAQAADGRHRLSCRDRLAIPAGLRRRCGIEVGDRVLLAAEPANGVLSIYSPARLDALLDALSGPVRSDAP